MFPTFPPLIPWGVCESKQRDEIWKWTNINGFNWKKGCQFGIFYTRFYGTYEFVS